MLNHSPFFHSTLRKLVSVFGTLFNEVYVTKKDEDGDEIKRERVKIAYAPKEKFEFRLRQDPTLDRPVGLSLPRMGFRISSLKYDGERKRVKIKKHLKKRDGTTYDSTFTAAPYNIEFTLYIIAKTQTEANQIVEQILPYFCPDYQTTYKPLSEYDFEEDLPITLLSVAQQDNYDDEWKEVRHIVWTLQFEIKANFYGYVETIGIIREVQVDLHATSDLTDEGILKSPRNARITVQPNPPDADPEDDYGYTTIIEEFTDNKRFNPHTLEDEDIE